MKNNKGITLVALIITIIVMLILVATTVAILIDSDLIGKADEATNAYKVREHGENTYGMNVTINGKNYTSVGDYGKTEDGEDDAVIVIDPNGELILHVFGKKFKISDTMTWAQLDAATDEIILAQDEVSGGYTINGEAAYSAMFFCPGITNNQNIISENLSSFNGGYMAISESWFYSNNCPTTLGSAKLIEGFEENIIYVEEFNNETEEKDSVIVIDPNGTNILHVFGQKYRISDSTTWEMLNESSSTIYIATDAQYGIDKINGNFVHTVTDVLANPGTNDGLLWYQTMSRPTNLRGNIKSTLTGNALVLTMHWMGSDALDSLEEIKALEGFEANSIYIE